MNTSLNPARRAKELAELRNNPQVDLVVIGGGITGAGIALDAASRGLNTVLVEKYDLGFGTSRWSSKLAHGGLRYLAKFEIGIAYNSAKERHFIMTNNAPHLVKPLAQVTPLNDTTNLFQKVAIRFGFLAGDMLRIAAGTRCSTLPRAGYVSKAEALKLCPQAVRKGLRGAWINYDGQMIDDARMVTAAVRTAAGEGAKVLTYCEASEAKGNSVVLTDTLSGESFTLNAKAVINATGVWAAGLDDEIKIRPARGTHLVFDAKQFGNPTGALVSPLPGSISRFLFILPVDKDRCYLGLTDEDNPGAIPDVPPTPEEDIDFLLDNINYALDKKLTKADVRGAFTGLRPLIADSDSESTADLSRRHATIISPEGLVSVVGGKFTEYRLMAEEALDATLKYHNMPLGMCRTRNLPFVGAPTHPDSILVKKQDLASLPESLVARFGYEAPKVIAEAKIDRPTDRVAGLDLLRAEVEWAITHEGAMKVADIIERRTRLSLIASDAAAAEAEIREIFEKIR